MHSQKLKTIKSHKPQMIKLENFVWNNIWFFSRCCCCCSYCHMYELEHVCAWIFATSSIHLLCFGFQFTSFHFHAHQCPESLSLSWRKSILFYIFYEATKLRRQLISKHKTKSNSFFDNTTTSAYSMACIFFLKDRYAVHTMHTETQKTESKAAREVGGRERVSEWKAIECIHSIAF